MGDSKGTGQYRYGLSVLTVGIGENRLSEQEKPLARVTLCPTKQRVTTAPSSTTEPDCIMKSVQTVPLPMSTGAPALLTTVPSKRRRQPWRTAASPILTFRMMPTFSILPQGR